MSPESGRDARDAFHVPAMAREVMELLRPGGDGVWLDCTAGGGGHARLIAGALAPEATLLALDRDPEAVDEASRALAGAQCRVVVRRAHFGDAGRILDEMGMRVNGALWDLGLSSRQLLPGRGFSIRDLDSQLLMCQDPDQETSAAVILNSVTERELADLIFANSDERFSRRIAASIVRSRPLVVVKDLVDAVLRSLPAGYRNRDDVLRRVAQAVRMAVNSELPQLQESLEEVARCAEPGARLVTLSYHSGEDRVVKVFFQGLKRQGGAVVLTPKPLRPSDEECRANSRARPARLRAVEVL